MQPLAAVVPSAIRMLLQQGEMSPGKLAFAWSVVVGPAIDRVTTVALGDGGVVQVSAADPTWRQELRRSQPVILDRLRGLLGHETVRAVRILSRPRTRR
jgi:predicted nucleic acid-binding Zn ribbon protein